MSGTHTALGLRAAGCRVIVLAATGGRGAYERDGLRWALAPRAGSDEFLRVVGECVRTWGVDHVLPLTEPLQQRIWDASPAWIARLFPRVDEPRRVLFRSKRILAEHAASRGIPIPAHVAVRGADDLREAIAQLGLPAVVKGVRGRGGSATRIVDSAAGAAAALREIGPAGGECFVQEYVPGTTYLVGGLFDEGRPLRLYAAEKLELHPARTGPSVRLRSVHEPRLVAHACALALDLRLSGLASMDFIRRGDGEFLFLELNPRPWGSIAAAASAGVDLFTPLAALLGGARAPEPELAYRAGVESSVFPLYLLAAAHWRGLRALGELVEDLRGPQGEPWREPRQAAHLLHRLVRVGRNWGRG